MNINNIKKLYTSIEASLLTGSFLEKSSLTKKEVGFLLKKYNWKENIKNICKKEKISCIDIF